MSTLRAEVTGSNTEICRVGGHPGDMNLFSSRGQIFPEGPSYVVTSACGLFHISLNKFCDKRKGEGRGKRVFDRHTDQSELPLLAAAAGVSGWEGDF